MYKPIENKNDFELD